jgi:hypothetical protein
MASDATYERIGKLLYGVQRLGGPHRLLGLQANPAVPPALASSGRQLAERFMAIAGGFAEGAARPTEAEVDAILEGTPELLASVGQGMAQEGIDPWRDG